MFSRPQSRCRRCRAGSNVGTLSRRRQRRLLESLGAAEALDVQPKLDNEALVLVLIFNGRSARLRRVPNLFRQRSLPDKVEFCAVRWLMPIPTSESLKRDSWRRGARIEGHSRGEAQAHRGEASEAAAMDGFAGDGRQRLSEPIVNDILQRLRMKDDAFQTSFHAQGADVIEKHRGARLCHLSRRAAADFNSPWQRRQRRRIHGALRRGARNRYGERADVRDRCNGKRHTRGSQTWGPWIARIETKRSVQLRPTPC
mmetsp:Transcript_100553/g.283586  ORF Transcript_100553/g.283586 Transcript_100553/m.283586 type:complete len:256 (-) Transcript_100553:583-1350(-)